MDSPEYKVIYANDAGALTQSVNDQIKVGWLPKGGVSIVRRGKHPSEEKFIFGQALVRRWNDKAASGLQAVEPMVIEPKETPLQSPKSYAAFGWFAMGFIAGIVFMLIFFVK